MIFVIAIGFMVLAWGINYKLKSKFKKYSQIPLRSGVSGAEAAYQMLRDHKIYDVEITCIPGRLTDHYNPADKTINLSEDVFHGRNAAAVAVAAHECGHAVQHATAYSWLEFRSTLAPLQFYSSRILNIIFFMSIFGVMASFIPYSLAILAIVISYGVIALFSVITLPVEVDATNRALAWVHDTRVVDSSEYEMSKDALKWASYTYFVAALSAITYFIYYLLQFIGMSDD